LMKLENCAIDSREYELKFWIVFEDVLVAIKTRKCAANVGIGIKESIENVSMVTCKLITESESNLKRRQLENNLLTWVKQTNRAGILTDLDHKLNWSL